jgi:hypothetical protein
MLLTLARLCIGGTTSLRFHSLNNTPKLLPVPADGPPTHQMPAVSLASDPRSSSLTCPRAADIPCHITLTAGVLDQHGIDRHRRPDCPADDTRSNLPVPGIQTASFRCFTTNDTSLGQGAHKLAVFVNCLAAMRSFKVPLEPRAVDGEMPDDCEKERRHRRRQKIMDTLYG